MGRNCKSINSTLLPVGIQCFVLFFAYTLCFLVWYGHFIIALALFLLLVSTLRLRTKVLA